ncbi:DEKNAAC103854 [Brettanomyces naardenensis]|uniref:DEKNAAC103854 n=1 Tax=Brettanomyces naardenensis TaxID=13370 RepID=A0A448YPA9_BRENA|nr:DEKNAAC103854 [Brettanomyces naardenensis]
MSQKVNLNELEPQQILQFKAQINKELDNLQGSFRALKLAQMKYKECHENVQRVNVSPNQEIMVPLTASLYLPGKIKDNDKFLIDVGTGYYVEKSSEEAVKFFDGRLSKLNQDSTKLTQLIREKLQLVQRVDEVLREKLAVQQKEIEKQHAK